MTTSRSGVGRHVTLVARIGREGRGAVSADQQGPVGARVARAPGQVGGVRDVQPVKFGCRDRCTQAGSASREVHGLQRCRSSWRCGVVTMGSPAAWPDGSGSTGPRSLVSRHGAMLGPHRCHGAETSLHASSMRSECRRCISTAVRPHSVRRPRAGAPRRVTDPCDRHGDAVHRRSARVVRRRPHVPAGQRRHPLPGHSPARRTRRSSRRPIGR